MSGKGVIGVGPFFERLRGIATESQDGRGSADDHDVELVRDGRGRMVNAKTGAFMFVPVEAEDEGGEGE